jgi:hypothetical protein
MKAEQRTVFVARDGQEFPTEAQCRAHERKTCGSALIGLTEAQVEAARTRADPELAEAIEAFGYELRKARQASGQLKRQRANGAAANNEGEKAGKALPDDAGRGSAGESPNRTEKEQAMGAA